MIRRGRGRVRKASIAGGGRGGRVRGNSISSNNTASSITAGTPQPTHQRRVNLNSRSETTVSNIVFLPANQHRFPIAQFECFDRLATSERIREWLQATDSLDVKDLQRLDDQEFNLIGPLTECTMILLEGAASLKESSVSIPISILALHSPTNTRFHFFWTPFSPSVLLTDLAIDGLIGPKALTEEPHRYSSTDNPLPPRHHTLYTILKENFRLATTYPESDSFHLASQMSDTCPRIRNPIDAHRRIEAEDALHSTNNAAGDGKDLVDDRYIFDLAPAERALASLVYMCCAEYLLLKRKYFKSFSRDCVLLSQKIRLTTAAGRVNRRRFPSVATTEDYDDVTSQSDVANQSNSDDNDANEDGDVATNDSPLSNRNDTPATIPIAHTTRSHDQQSTTSTLDSTSLHNPNRKPSLHNRRNTPLTRTLSASTARNGSRARAERVRTFTAHVKAIEAATGWSTARSRRLAVGWEMLGFLDEARVLAVVEGEESEGEY